MTYLAFAVGYFLGMACMILLLFLIRNFFGTDDFTYMKLYEESLMEIQDLKKRLEEK
jgi:hypothetical protein